MTVSKIHVSPAILEQDLARIPGILLNEQHPVCKFLDMARDYLNTVLDYDEIEDIREQWEGSVSLAKAVASQEDWPALSLALEGLHESYDLLYADTDKTIASSCQVAAEDVAMAKRLTAVLVTFGSHPDFARLYREGYSISNITKANAELTKGSMPPYDPRDLARPYDP